MVGVDPRVASLKVVHTLPIDTPLILTSDNEAVDEYQLLGHEQVMLITHAQRCQWVPLRRATSHAVGRVRCRDCTSGELK